LRDNRTTLDRCQLTLSFPIGHCVPWLAGVEARADEFYVGPLGVRDVLRRTAIATKDVESTTVDEIERAVG